MQCPRCQHENPPGTKFCGECAAPLAPTCPSCGTANPPENKFCGQCAALLRTTRTAKFAAPDSYTPKHLAEKILTSKSALEGERKLVTVLFCDLVNSTGLAEQIGAEPMHTLLNEFFGLALAEVHRFEGTINQFLGDGFMALFGAPIAHEDHARRAVLAAWSLRRAFQEREPDRTVRMGLNSGFVVVGSIGDNLRMDYTAVGDTTNLAARLQQLAEPGTVLISEATSRLVAGQVRVAACPAVQVKGKIEPIVAYEVRGPAPSRSPMEPHEDLTLSAFAGRGREIDALLDLLAQIESGQGQVVGIVGEPGVGKSRVLYEFRQRLAGRRLTALEGRCVSYGSAIPYLPVLDIVRGNCGIVDADAPEATIEKVHLALQEIGMDADERAPYVLHLLGMKERTGPLETLSTEAIKTRTFDTLRQMSLRGSARRPLILAVEDLHWIDTTSEEFLASLVESLPGAPILVLVTYRPGYRPAWIDKSYATQLALRPLSSRDSLTIVQSVGTQARLSDDLAHLIIDKAEGNPFFLEELTRVAVEGRDFQSAAGLPDTIQAVLMARIDRLPDAPKRLLQTAAVLGREFSRRLLEAIWEDPGDLEPHLRELRHHELVYERRGIDEPVYVFKHALTQEVASAGLLTPRRQALHAAAGRAIEAAYEGRLDQVYDQLAHHYAKTTDTLKAVEYLSRFADKAGKAHAHVEALTALQEALVHAEQLPVEERDRAVVSIVLRMAESLHYVGRRQEIVDLMVQHQERLDRIQDPALAGPFYFRLGWTRSFLGDREQTGQNLMRAFAAAMESNDHATMGKASILGAMERGWTGQHGEGIELGRRAIALLEETDDRWWVGYAHFMLAAIYTAAEDFDLAFEHLAKADTIAEHMGDRRLHAIAGAWRGLVHASFRGEWEQGIEALERACALSPDAFETAWILGFLGDAYRVKGDLPRALAVGEEALQQAKRYRSPQVVAWFQGLLAEHYLLDGRLELATGLAIEALAVARDTNVHIVAGGAQSCLGRIALARGNFAEADARLRDALQTFDSIHLHGWHARVLLDFAALAYAQGNREAVSAHLAEACSLFKVVKTPRWVERVEQLAREFGVFLPAAS